MSIPGAAVRCPHQKGPTHEETDMSFQAYLDTIETKTGKTPRTLVEEANAKGLGGPDAKAGPVVAWLKEEYGLGRGHAMALFYVIKNGTKIGTKHVGTGGAH